MPDVPGEPWLDEAAGRLVRPFTIVDGRTKATSHFDLMTMVLAAGDAPPRDLGPDHLRVLELCVRPITVAELAATMRLPATVIKIMLSDLVECGAVATHAFDRAPQGRHHTDRELLEAVLDGLLKRL
jgi:hypothetical protein